MLLQNSVNLLNDYKEKLLEIMEDESKEILFDRNKQESIKIINDSIKKLSDIVLKEKSNIKVLEENTGMYFTEVQRQFIETNYSFQQTLESELQKPMISIVNVIESFSDLIESNIELYNMHKTVPIFMEILGKEQSIVLVGKNGVGKSTFIDDLKKNSIISTYSIPAQKNLMYIKPSMNLKIEDVKNNFRKQNLKENSTQYYDIQKTLDLFSKLVEGTIKEHQSSKSDSKEIRDSILDKVNKYFNKLFPYLSLRTNSEDGVLLVENSLYEEKITYGINSLSDGEKSVLCYLCSIFHSDGTDIYVIDEPETHIHMALAIELWDMILEEKKDSKFIFISHNPQFILTRKNSRILWCKAYRDIYNNEIIPIGDSLPREVILELIGTQKTILFCEGRKSSLDYQVYDRLYSNKYHIVPVGGHRKVIDYTRVINATDAIDNDAIGIIDKDFHSEEELESYKKDNIYHLPYNEIEMLLMEKIILKEVEKYAISKFIITNIEKQFREYLKKDHNINRQVGSRVKYRLENEIEINNISNKMMADSEIDKILAKLEDAKKWFSEEKENLEKIYKDENTLYEELLEMCSLKNEITKELMNKYESNYEDRALKAINREESIKNYLRNKINLPER